MGSQTLDGHQPTASPASIWTYPSYLVLKFEAHSPVSSSQCFKLLYILREYHLQTDGTREQECRMGSHTLDGHQPTAPPSRIWTYPSYLIRKFEAHSPVSSSKRFKLLYILRDGCIKSDGTREQQCRLGTQTLDGQQPTSLLSRIWTCASHIILKFEAHSPIFSLQRFKLLYILRE